MRARCLDLVQVLAHLLALVHVVVGQRGEAHDGVHGRADVVGHVGQERALGLAGAVGAVERFLQQLLLLHLLARLLVDVAQAQHDEPVFARRPAAGAHHGGLAVLHLVAPDGAIQRIEALALGQLGQDGVAIQRRRQGLAVIVVHAALDVGGQRLGHGRAIAEHGLEPGARLLGQPHALALAGIQVEGAYHQVVLAQGAHQVLLAALAALLLALLVGVVEQEALVQQLAILLDELHVAHDVHQRAVVVAHAILDAHAVAHMRERGELLAQHLLVLVEHR